MTDRAPKTSDECETTIASAEDECQAASDAVNQGDRRGVISTAILKALSYCSFEKVAVVLLGLCGLYFLTDPLDSKVQVKALCGVLIVRFFVKAEKKAVEFGAVDRYSKEQQEAKERMIQAAKIAEAQRKRNAKEAKND